MDNAINEPEYIMCKPCELERVKQILGLTEHKERAGMKVKDLVEKSEKYKYLVDMSTSLENCDYNREIYIGGGLLQRLAPKLQVIFQSELTAIEAEMEGMEV